MGKPTKWHYCLARGVVADIRNYQPLKDAPVQTIETESGVYEDAVREIFSRLAENEISNGPITVKIWVPQLIPHYGPYFYTAFQEDGKSTFCLSWLWERRALLVATS